MMPNSAKPRIRETATAAKCMEEVREVRGKVEELERQIATLGMKAAIDQLASRVAAIEAAIFKK